jgi:transposase
MESPQELKDLSKEELINIILDLRKRLLAYENAHTPPSQQRKYPKREKSGKGVGAPKGHEGKTRPTPEPNKFEELKLDSCPNCNKQLGRPRSLKKKIIEDIPEPQPLIITQFTIPCYFCAHCKAEVSPSHPHLPSEGRFGPNLQAQITSLRFENRLPPRKIAELLSNQYRLHITHSTVLDIFKRVAYKLQPLYEEIKKGIKKAKQVNADETGQKVNGKSFWSWVFVSLTSILFLIRKSRGQDPIIEALGKKFKGLLGCDGWQSYTHVADLIQRCWAHLLREAKWYAEQYKGQAKTLYKSLCKLFDVVKSISKETEQAVREKTYKNCIQKMQFLIKACNAHKELRKFAIKIKNGLEHWFTRVLYPEIEPTNNKAERALREIVIQERISKQRTEEGARIKEVIMSVLATWNLRGLNTHSMLRQVLSS